MKRFLPLILLVCGCLLPLFFPSCANTTQAPSGGKKDTIPPYIIDIKPLPGVVGVPLTGASFAFTFNEYVTIKDANGIFLSPPSTCPLTDTTRCPQQLPASVNSPRNNVSVRTMHIYLI